MVVFSFCFISLNIIYLFCLVLCSLDGKDNVDIFQDTDQEDSVSVEDAKPTRKRGATIKAINKRPIVITDSEDDGLVNMQRHYHLSDLISHSNNVTPPPTPSPVKAGGSKKRTIGNSNEEDVFVPRYLDIYTLCIFF